MLDRDALRKAAANRRTDAVSQPAANTIWHCEFCRRDYQTESGFMRHFCPQRERIEELRSPVGQAAYAYYCEWMRLGKRSVPSAETFLESSNYKHFIRFAQWTEKVAIPNPVQFIKVMVETGTSPTLWCRSNTYSMYLQVYDSVHSPAEQFLETYDRLVTLAREHGVPLNKVYAAIGPSDLAKLIRKRRLSPWLLVVSPNFLRWIQTLGVAEREQLSSAIDFEAYVEKLRQEPIIAREFRNACEAEDV